MSETKAIVYSKDACGYCIRAKKVLEKKGFTLVEKKIDSDISLDDARKELGREFKTVPQIQIENQYIGGYTELCKYFNIKAR